MSGDRAELIARIKRHSEELYELYRDVHVLDPWAASPVYSAMEPLDSAVEELGGKTIAGELAPKPLTS